MRVALQSLLGAALLLLAALQGAAAAQSHERLIHERVIHERVVRARVTHVSDGDTLWVRTNEADKPPLKLRLIGIDAPERCQAHGERAREALKAHVLGRRVTVRTRAIDAWGRAIARVSLQGADVGAWLVAEGHAWSTGYRGRAGTYARQQRAAQAARKGLFADAAPPLSPREFRRQHGPCRPVAGAAH